MEKYAWLQILGASLIGAAFFFFIILPVLYWTLYPLFSFKMKVVEGKIIRIKKRESSIWIADQFIGSTDLSSSNLGSPASGRFVDISEYSLFFEEERNHSRYFVQITQKAFEELKGEKVSSLKNVSLSFKEWFWERSFDHFEIEIA